MIQSSMFDAEAARDEAMARSEAHAAASWKQAAAEAVVGCARNLPAFTTDDVHRLLDETGAVTHDTRALGPVMRNAARAGLIETTDQYVRSSRVDCHARPIRVWRSKVAR